MTDASPVVVVTGANGLVGSRVCAATLERSAQVRAVVRRASTAPNLADVTEHVGDFADPRLVREVTTGAYAVVTTVHPMCSDRQAQHQVAVEGTPVLARAARDAGAARLVHVSTCPRPGYDRSPAPVTCARTARSSGPTAPTTRSPSSTRTAPWPRSTG